MPAVRCRVFKSGRKAVSDLVVSTIDRLRVEVPEAEGIAHMTHVWNAISSEICTLDHDDEVPFLERSRDHDLERASVVLTPKSSLCV